MADNRSGSMKMRPPFEDIEAHYDISDDFFGLFLDPSRTYSCAFFEREEMTVQQAQIAKIDLALGKLGLQPGMTLLDIGCGWGSAMKRAMEKYDVNVVGLTLSKNQRAFSRQLLDQIDTNRSHRVLLRGWEEIGDPVDRIVSIEAFEAFGKPRYAAFFETAYRLLPSDGRMVLETIFTHPPSYWHKNGIPITMSDLRFMRFIARGDISGGWPCQGRRRRILAQRRFFDGRPPALEPALCSDTGYLGGELGGRSWRRGRHHFRRGLRALPAVLDRMRRLLPARHHRGGTVHTHEGIPGGRVNTPRTPRRR